VLQKKEIYEFFFYLFPDPENRIFGEIFLNVYSHRFSGLYGIIVLLDFFFLYLFVNKKKVYGYIFLFLDTDIYHFDKALSFLFEIYIFFLLCWMIGSVGNLKIFMVYDCKLLDDLSLLTRVFLFGK
jgi:hypothetical protein